MRRLTVAAVLAFVVLVMLAPPGFAQAPAPKVTISGLFDQITAAGNNIMDGNLTRNSDSEWYARTRFRPDFEFAVGRVRAVLGIEIDLAYGQMGPNDGGFPGNTTGSSGAKVNTNGSMDLGIDIGGMLEVKWIYTEFPLTGKDSLLPFIPVETMARAGGQPFDTLAQYKLAQYANGDFAGVSAITTYAPGIRSQLGWVIIEDQLAGANRGNPSTKTGRGEDSALIASMDITPTKGLDLKPMYSWIHLDGQTSGAVRRNLVNRLTAGGTLNGTAALGAPTNAAAAGSPTYHQDRHTLRRRPLAHRGLWPRPHVLLSVRPRRHPGDRDRGRGERHRHREGLGRHQRLPPGRHRQLPARSAAARGPRGVQPGQQGPRQPLHGDQLLSTAYYRRQLLGRRLDALLCLEPGRLLQPGLGHHG
jgi:hypothetical protein